jgi:phosphate transport system permease protein
MSERRAAPGDLTAGALGARQAKARAGQAFFLVSTLFALLALAVLALNIADSAFGYAAVRNKVEPAALSDRPLDQLPQEALAGILKANLTPGVYRRYDSEKPFTERSQADVLALVWERVVQPQILKTWPLLTSLFDRASVEAELAASYPGARLEFRSWLNADFLGRPMSSIPAQAGARTAILGTLALIVTAMAVAVPVGVGAAVYMEEFADRRSRLNQLIETNITNLAGVPSIIYGMLGLVIFVRVLEPLTSGAAFGVAGNNGRTVLSGALTMALLLLPLIIINAREAIRAVPDSLRQASFGLGATRWQTVWHHVLPAALPGMLTGTILALSRGIGETAPLILAGASTYIVTDPGGLFSKYTVLPIQIYDWTSRPEPQFRNAAAAAIIALLVMMVALNMTAILLRNRLSRRRAL